MNFNLNVQIFGQLKPYSPTISLARVRILYKGRNRNSTFITDEFADKLLSSLSYTPVKGIYEVDDFTDHGKKRTEGRIYGIVPENPNLTWEKHEDEDGVIRTYACADVLLFTALYPEASEIPGKSQSMEMYVKSIKGDWQIIDKSRVFVYTDGCFLGLQALGDKVTPCFEGAEFFSYYTNLKNLLENLEGGEKMALNFKLSDSKKHDMLFTLINPNYTSEGNWEVTCSICDIYDEYALCYDYEQQGFCRVYYQKDDEKDTVALGEKRKCFIVDVTEGEYEALNMLKVANGGDFTKVDEVFTTANSKIETLTNDLSAKESELQGKITDYDTKVTELEIANTTISERDVTIASLQETVSTIAEKDSQIEALTGELSTLKDYKLEQEQGQKEAVIEKYTEILDEETIKTFSENLDKYSVIELKKELAFSASEKNPSIFSKKPDDPGYIPTDGADKHSGATKLLMKHKKK